MPDSRPAVAHPDSRVRALLRRVPLGAAGVALVAILVDGPAVRRGFASEDFLLLRFLAEHPPWREPATLFGPWLGISVVEFFRPLSTLLFALGAALSGLSAAKLTALHLALHAANAVAVGGIARELRAAFGQPPDDGLGWLAGLLFALHPLHPNAVLFLSSFATLYATCFLLAATWAYLAWRRRGSRTAFATALLGQLAALASYEVAVVGPAILALVEGLRPHAVPGEGWGRRLRAVAPFVVCVLAYFGLRRLLLGVTLGGYPQTAGRLVRLWTALPDLGTDLGRIAWPDYTVTPGPAGLPGLAVALLAGLATWAARRGWAPHQGALRLGACGLGWAVIGLAPFGFVPVVPGNGRYLYLAVAGAAVGLVTVLGGLVPPSSPRLKRWPWFVLGVLALGWASLLRSQLADLRAAGAAVRSLQSAARIRFDAEGSPPERVFVLDYPRFVDRPSGVPAAQVFHYGLADALAPPFLDRALPVTPLPELPAESFDPLARRPGWQVWRWLRDEARFATWEPVGEPLPTLRGLAGPQDGADLAAVLAAPGVSWPRGGHERFRLIVLTAGNPAVVAIEAPAAGRVRATLPVAHLQAMAQLYPRHDALWWVEACDAGSSRPLATTPPRQLLLHSAGGPR